MKPSVPAGGKGTPGVKTQVRMIYPPNRSAKPTGAHVEIDVLASGHHYAFDLTQDDLNTDPDTVYARLAERLKPGDDGRFIYAAVYNTLAGVRPLDIGLRKIPHLSKP